MSVDRAKQAARESVWQLLEERQAAPAGVRGRIPAFFGADDAADRLAALPEWTGARVVKAVPDRPQLPVRARALEQGKLVYMAVPKLAEPKPFYTLDPAVLTVSPLEAADKGGAAKAGTLVEVDAMRPVDLVVCGSVAVDVHGGRLGKGAGYSDLELAFLHEAGVIDPNTTIVTTVHDLQVVDGELPETDHDFGVDLIVTPTTVIRCDNPRRPKGLQWSDLPAEKIAAIPALAARIDQRG
ncbi:5-formyltetrahydrofolate cyclo-ligase [Prauserella halophila]|uniref:5-formyltetrahydrofolate cyclo-ligase n=1 Tax=Prauserella halophila TaxID=185641 RepID=A0ABP4H8N7_9PSEU|nr:5-formyltetrahydrofolate cyclo-ligase [Prauserella halophila]